MRNTAFILCAMLFAAVSGCEAAAAQSRFVILGDMHMDRFEFHDMDYVYTRPSDWRQVTREYPYFTAAYTPKLLGAVTRRVQEGAEAVIQLGDLMEGVAGNDSLARSMARWSVGMIDAAAAGAKVVLVKGNHDVSASPGQPEAWRSEVLPYVERQSGQSLENGMYRLSLGEDADLFVAEQFFSPDGMLPEQALIDFLEREIPRSTARHKFLLTHQPVIPVTERCWHLFSGIRRKVDDPAVRERFLELLAKNRITVLCAHLHRYSKCVRSTEYGNIVQIMMVSTVDSYAAERRQPRIKAFPDPQNLDAQWQPHTLGVRRELIEAERRHIVSFESSYRPGYAVAEVSADDAVIKFYDGYDDTPAESFSINQLYECRPQ